ncbi:MAG: 2-succinyl-5-enolpyruvyl-6-hydroxy-3-cyclohexene-1-carboxylic-acid synthase, partial [Propionibacteriaceae bacterium]|nr:2-succinyl-5-enolpyruvyl-6-hydroxy-3-cyclohexene-1-carboxylic-acid synthase [Propionibacteriaceae bacterium]
MSSTAIARALVAHLAAAGVHDVVLSPGSRSAPLAYASADAASAGHLRTHIRVDERTAGFFALGLARAHAVRGVPRPVAVVTTSGTAVANLHPAVLEAHHTGVPLLVISTDRPHEWHGTGANQTTRQTGIFGQAVRATMEIPARANPAAVRGQATRLVAAALGTFTRDPGPVHLNVSFAEPLVPDAPAAAGSLPEPVRLVAPPAAVPVALPAGRRTLAVAGDGAGPDAARLAADAGWPLLAEPSSGARLPGAIVHYLDHLAAGLADGVERVVVFGHPTLSRPISALLARPGDEVVVVSPTARWTDVAGTATLVAGAVSVAPPTADDAAWLARWQDADAAFSLEATPMQEAALALWESDAWLVLGSSNTVRAFDTAVPGAERGARVLANRGLAGIDGLVSTAHGLAAGLGEPVRVVLGDLSFAHDVGGLARGDLEPELDLQVVVLDDHGGGIFASLEHADAEPEMFRRYFSTPQTQDVVAAARGVGARASVVSVSDLPDALAAPIRGREVLHVPLRRGP